uniref:Major facilitator superfamily (MFS) profile domain-containing protein n=1 Tax=Daucus carota subsp. sativus TaxID=79200 RepID=A0A164V501_DAUCS
MIMMPLIGNLSDVYGTKTMLTLPMTMFVIPLAILAYSKKRYYFYAYFVLRIVTAMVANDSVQCLALAYVEQYMYIISKEILWQTLKESTEHKNDILLFAHKGKRCTVIEVLSGVGSSAYLGGTLVARFRSDAQASQVSAFISILATVYMRIFLKESSRHNEVVRQPLLKTSKEHYESDGDSSSMTKVFKKIPSPADFVFLLKSSPTFLLAVTVAFFQSFGDGGLASSLLLLIMPLLIPLLGEEKLLSIGMLVGFLNMLVYSIAWSVWIPYAMTGFCMFIMFASPCGMDQGCISGISSIANIIAPLVFSPLTALFLSNNAPFHFVGFSLLCVGLAYVRRYCRV